MTALLLLPGLLCDAALWQFQASALAEFGPVIVPEYGEADTIEDMATEILAQAPQDFALAGLSMGGYVAFEIMRRAPERVRRIALIDTQARPETEESRSRRHALMSLVGKGHFLGVTPRLLPQLLHPDHVATELAQIVMGMAERVGPDAFLRQQAAIMGRTDSRPSLGEIKVPALVVCGDHDAITPPPIAREIADGIPGAELVIIERAGHLSPLEQPAAVNRAMIDWLTA